MFSRVLKSSMLELILSLILPFDVLMEQRFCVAQKPDKNLYSFFVAVLRVEGKKNLGFTMLTVILFP